MMFRKLFYLSLILCTFALDLQAQRYWGRRSYDRSVESGETIRDRNGVPIWEIPPTSQWDTFTFARVIYSSARGGRSSYFGGWATDRGDAELNLSWRLQEMTSMQVNPEPISIELTDPELFNYPFIYMVEPGGLYFSQTEAEALRRYLLSGGFMMVDDFWMDYEYENFYMEIKKVFPDREPVDLPLDHPIFNIVFKINEKPQVPNVRLGTESQWHGQTCEVDKGPGDDKPHYRAILDDKGRIMVMVCHNTDLGDGWEREGENEYYFREFSEKKAYPLGINILVYSMTH